MDPFEARLSFVKLLQRLNASVQAIENTIEFLQTNRDLEEDLYACILQELENTGLNTRLNIFYFLESLCEHIHVDSKFLPGNRYKDNITRDFSRIFQLVVPAGRLGLINLSAAEQVIENLRAKKILSEEAFLDVDRIIEDKRKQLTISPVEVSSLNSPLIAGGSTNGTPAASLAEPSSLATTASTVAASQSAGDELKKEDILRRMDEDRERQKRLKETIWAIDYKASPDMEFNTLWETCGPVNEFTARALQEEDRMWHESWYGHGRKQQR